jgi:hypothetical protein
VGRGSGERGEGEGGREWARVGESVCARARVCACARVCVCACACVCVCVCQRRSTVSFMYVLVQRNI